MTRSTWVPLSDALWIAFYGDTKDDCRTQPGALLHGLKRTEIPAIRREFDIALSEAASNGNVHFKGYRSPNSADVAEITSDHFLLNRGFELDNTVQPWPHDPLRHRRKQPLQRGITWTDVHVDYEKFLKWLASTYPEVPRPKRQSLSGSERKEAGAIVALSLHLKDNTDLTREDAKNFLKEKGFKFSERGFQGRFWPKARGQAGLSTRAPAGAKKKKLRHSFDSIKPRAGPKR